MDVQKSEEAFTILEVVVAIVVAAIFTIGMSAAIANVNGINAQTVDLAIANGFIESKVEDLRNASFVALPAASATPVDFSGEMPATLTEPRAAQYVVSDENPSVKKVEFTITYTTFGKTQTLKYATLIGELGVGQY